MEADRTGCMLCPRRCRIDRHAGARGVCGMGSRVMLARAALHAWEEPPISGASGSGTVFFSGCPLHCVYCQNAAIANGSVGMAVDEARLAQIFLEQQARGARNINLVTPTHYAPAILRALDMARSGSVEPRPEQLAAIERHADAYPYARLEARELDIPVVYNTSGYELPEAIAQLSGYVDVFLTDFKYASGALAERYSHAADYPHLALEALDAMYALVGPCRFEPSPVDGHEQLSRGIIVRHLMLPGQLADSCAVMDLLAARPYAGDIWVSLMNQYTPMPQVEAEFPELAGHVSDEDYDALVDYALLVGLENSFMQEGGSALESFIPAFDYEGVL